MTETQTAINGKVTDLDWVLSTMDSNTGAFVIQMNRTFYGQREMKELSELGLSVVAISSNGVNGQLRIHVGT